jgi:trimethylamine:corrinoid methyltransferase-like protein
MEILFMQINEWVPKIINGAARVLAEKGIFVASTELLADVAGQEGITVQGQRVRFEESLTVGFLEQYHVARPFTPPEVMTVSSGAHANHIVDLQGNLRPLTMADVEWAARLAGALAGSGVNAYAPGIPQDVPAPLQGLAQLVAGARNKPGQAIYALHYPAAQPFINECRDILGQPQGAGIHVVSPLRFEGQEVEEALQLRGNNPDASIGVGSMPIVGVSTPATALGGAVTALAEVVGGALLLLQSARRWVAWGCRSTSTPLTCCTAASSMAHPPTCFSRGWSARSTVTSGRRFRRRHSP